MEIYSTEEQQVEAIKSWWQKHGNQAIFGILVGLGAIWGWGAWQDHVASTQEQASSAYEAAVQRLAEDGNANVLDEAERYIAEYGDSGYAALAALHGAKEAVAQDDLAKARQLLEQARARLDTPAIEPLVRQRLVRVIAAQGELPAALALAEEPVGAAWQGRFDELRGDLLLAQGDRDAARTAYQAALSAQDANPLLQMKLADLAVH